MNNLIEVFEREFLSDDGLSLEKKEESILELYKMADNEGKYIINQLFIHLCGYSLDTLVSYAKGGDVNDG